MNILKKLTIGLMLAGSLVCASYGADILEEESLISNDRAYAILQQCEEDEESLLAPLTYNIQTRRGVLAYNAKIGIQDERLAKVTKALDGISFHTNRKIYALRIETEEKILRMAADANAEIQKILDCTDEELEKYIH